MFTSDRDGDAEIFLMLSNGTLRQLTRNQNIEDGEAAWSPDGRLIAFVREDEFGSSFLYTMRSDGTDQRFVVEGRELEHPTWSPDGRSIAISEEGDIVTIRSTAPGSGSSRRRARTRTLPGLPMGGGSPSTPTG